MTGVALLTGVLESKANAQPRVRVDGVINALAFAHSGEWLAVGYGDDAGVGRTRVYPMKRRARDHVELPRLPKPIVFVAFLDQDKYLAVADESSELVVWSWPDLDEILRVNLGKKQGQPGSRFHLLGNPQGPQIAWVEIPPGGAEGKVEVAELPAGNVVTSISMVRIDHQVAWSRDGAYLLLAGAVWNWDTLASWKPDSAGVTAVSDDGTKAASAPREKCDGISILELSARKVLRTVEVEDVGCPVYLWFIDGGKALAWLGEVGTGDEKPSYALYRWDAKLDRVKNLRRRLPSANAAVLSPNGRLIAAANGRRVSFHKLR